MKKNIKKYNKVCSLILVMCLFCINVLFTHTKISYAEGEIGYSLTNEKIDKEIFSDLEIEKNKSDKLLEKEHKKNLDETYHTIKQMVVYEPVKFQTRSATVNISDGTAYLGDSERELNLVPETLAIKKEIDYAKHTITWTVDLHAPDGTWRQANSKVRLWMPKYQSLTKFVKKDKNGTKEYDNVGFLKYDYPSNEFNSRFKNLISDAKNDQKLLNDLPYMLQEGRINHVLEDTDIEIPSKTNMEYTFITTHDKNIELDKVSLGVSIQTDRDRYRRTLLRGVFGIASRHEIQKPELIYVKNKDSLTDNEKAYVRNKILEATLKYYESKNMKNQIDEIKEANIVIDSNGVASITWKDGTVSSLNNPSEYIKEQSIPTISADLSTQTVLEGKEIKIVNINTTGDLEEQLSIVGDKPDWLIFTPLGNFTGGQLSGKPLITDWIDGETQRTFDIKLEIKDKFGNIANTIVNIVVKKDNSIIPVGVYERGYYLPYIYLTVIASLGIFLFVKNKNKEDFKL